MPHRRSGLWEMSIDTQGGPGVRMTMQTCVDAATDKDFAWHGPHSPGRDCDQTQMHPTADGIVFDTTCKMRGRTVVSHGVVKGDLDKAYDVDVTTTMSPSPAGMPAGMKTSIKARWLGACPAGVKPGHVTMGNMKIGR